jgi:DNA-binding transcriptional LysR family regulator
MFYNLLRSVNQYLINIAFIKLNARGLMNFDLQDLRLLVNTIEEGSLTSGARRSHLSPAAGSARLRQLEVAVGGLLFYREHRGMEATPLGIKMLQHARQILRQVEHAKLEISNMANGPAGHIRILAHATAATEYMPRALATFMAEYPGVTVDLQERMKRDILRGVIDGATDLGLLAGPIPTGNYEVIPFSQDRLILVVPNGHLLEKRRSVKLLETAHYQHVQLNDHTTHSELIAEVSLAQGIELSVRIKLGSFDAMCRMIESGVGIGIVPEASARRYERSMRIALVRISEPWAARARSIVVNKRSNLSKASLQLIDHLIKLEKQVI